jgi:homoaconitate hydratase
MALYPDPDNVVPVTTKSGMKLDGCFIGACTTTEEDLVLGALVLEAGLRMGKIPVSKGQRRVTPGSLNIIKNLERHGLLNIYKQAGFDVGAPGCSYCVGINDVDVAGEGETWLSSQNRNFRNRMGKGSFGNVTCAAVVAASSFTMEVTDAKPLLQMIDQGRFQRLIGDWKNELMVAPETHEPSPEVNQDITPAILKDDSPIPVPTGWTSNIVEANIQRFAENVDT